MIVKERSETSVRKRKDAAGATTRSKTPVAQCFRKRNDGKGKEEIRDAPARMLQPIYRIVKRHEYEKKADTPVGRAGQARRRLDSKPEEQT